MTAIGRHRRVYLAISTATAGGTAGVSASGGVPPLRTASEVISHNGPLQNGLKTKRPPEKLKRSVLRVTRPLLVDAYEYSHVCMDMDSILFKFI